MARYTSENIEYPYPINWSKTISNTHIYNRAHIIAYSLSAKNTEGDNIFIGTEYLNQISMRKVESDLYKEIKDDNRIFIYKVTPIYKEKNHIIPFGILFEAETIDNGDKEQYCKFCYNIEPKYIQGTKAFEDEVIEKGFRLCKDCTNYSKKN